VYQNLTDEFTDGRFREFSAKTFIGEIGQDTKLPVSRTVEAVGLL